MAHVVVIREPHRRADQDRGHLRHELLIDLVDDAFAGAWRHARAPVDWNGDNDRVLYWTTLIVSHRGGDLGGLRAHDADGERQRGVKQDSAHRDTFHQ